MSVIRSLALALLAILVAGGCTDSKNLEEDSTKATTSAPALDAGTASTTSSARTGANTTRPGTGAANTTTTPPTSGLSGTTPSHSGTTTTFTVPEGDFRSTVTLKRKCVEPGDLQTITVKTAPDAVTVYATQYADDDSHGNNGGGVSDGDGIYTDQFVVNAAAPRGKATMTATSRSKTRGMSFAQATFTVGC